MTDGSHLPEKGTHFSDSLRVPYFRGSHSHIHTNRFHYAIEAAT
jgi:hypothetical protein